ncbi:hypothetical protein AB3M89_05765 [Microbacterium sp. 179-I 3D2 NHS]|uniref:hypothetical protein n=1 Tax=Microbacterium sp. 179-I 3D2 NHS TaxID=3235178 RepID=UPI0039A1397D
MTRRSKQTLAAISVAVLIATLGTPLAAHADPGDPADVLAEAEAVALGAATPADVLPPVLEEDAGEASVSLNAIDLEVTLGGTDAASTYEADQYAIAESDSVTYAVSFPEEGATRFSALLATANYESPHWTFGSGTELLLLDDGSVTVSNGAEFLGGIESPWAIDAQGRSLPTHYEVSGSTLTQVIDTTGAVFPVVADPTVRDYGPYIQVHLNRSETIAAVAGYGVCAGILSKTKHPFGKALGLACTVVSTLGGAVVLSNQCISIHYVVGVGGPAGIWWPWVRKC